jgi:hypothetical protein
LIIKFNKNMFYIYEIKDSINMNPGEIDSENLESVI